jgi:putative DNA primase/helicase
MRYERDNVLEQAKGRWPGILGHLDLPERFLRPTHGPCPLCGGTNRFRFDNKEGRGTYFCSGCGPGDGIGLVMKSLNLEFRPALDRVREVLGMARPEPIKAEMREDERRDLLRKLWRSSHPVTPGDDVDRYLTARGVGRVAYPKQLRTCQSCWFSGREYHPAMVAVVSDPDGKRVTLHRTYLAEGRKLDVPEPRRLMPGKIPQGSAIRLAEPGPRLGIAEGIETALAASDRFGLPVWAALNTTMLSQWEPPPGVEEVVVFGDFDGNFAGQKAAYTLAHRLAVRKDGPTVSVQLPGHDISVQPDTDWADLVRRRA